jgi:hypothetical protein
MFDFKQLAKLTPVEVAFLTTRPEVPTVARPRFVTDDAQFETPSIDATATAAAIVTAAKLARSGGPMAPKMSDTAQAIIDAGKRRRGG